MLLTVIALGAAVTLLGMSGVVAVFTDRATTGDNSVSSGAVRSAADLQLAPMLNTGGCGSFADNLTTPLQTLDDAQPGSRNIERLCLLNAGSGSVAVTLSTLDLTDVEAGCTNDEAAAGDATCGTGAGELATQISAYWRQVDCTTGTASSLNYVAQLDAFPPTDLFTMASDETACLELEVFYGMNRTIESVQLAQSDQVTWKWAFDGTTGA